MKGIEGVKYGILENGSDELHSISDSFELCDAGFDELDHICLVQDTQLLENDVGLRVFFLVSCYSASFESSEEVDK